MTRYRKRILPHARSTPKLDKPKLTAWREAWWVYGVGLRAWPGREKGFIVSGERLDHPMKKCRVSASRLVLFPLLFLECLGVITVVLKEESW